MKQPTLTRDEISFEEVQQRRKFFLGGQASMTYADAHGQAYDPYLAGSVTYYGDGEKGGQEFGNVAFNSHTGHQQGINPKDNKPNEEVWLYSNKYGDQMTDFFNGQVEQILTQDPKALFIPWQQHDWKLLRPEFHKNVIAANSPELVAKFGDKISFKQIMAEHGIPQAPYEVMTGAEIQYLVETGVFPHDREVVIQSAYGINGAGTMMFTKEQTQDPWGQSAENLHPERHYIVMDYIKTLGSPAIYMQISDNEIGVYPIGMQSIVGGQTQGTDFGAFAQLPPEIQTAEMELAYKVGAILQQSGYRGIANLDTMITDGSAHELALATEINARHPSTIRLINAAAQRAGIGSAHAHTVAAHYQGHTDFATEIAGIPMEGKYHTGTHTRTSEGGVIIPKEYAGYNLEGLDRTTTEDAGQSHTYAVIQFPEHEQGGRK